MILLFNVIITNNRLYGYKRSPWYPADDRFDVFKYSLSSYGQMHQFFDKVILFVELGHEYKNRYYELEEYAKGIFGRKVKLFDYRNLYTRDWRSFCDTWLKDDNEIIWYCGNDDHIFIDYDLDVVRSAIDKMSFDYDPYSIFYYSHWPEQMRISYHYKAKLSECKDLVEYNWSTFDSIVAMKSARMKKYWFDTDFGDFPRAYRTDVLKEIGYEMTSKVYAPLREIIRHYDGYSHVGKLDNITSPIYIPPGFFDNDIKITIGSNNRKPGYTVLNPNSKNLYSFDKNGCDYRWVESDIPLFWRDKISVIDRRDTDENMIANRNKYFLLSSRMPIKCFDISFHHNEGLPTEWLEKHIK